MEKRIRYIYALSLLAALAAMAMQGYWLYNQYRYETARYAEETAGRVLQAGAEEFGIRKGETLGKKVSYVMDRSARFSSDTDSAVGKKTFADLSFTLKKIEPSAAADTTLLTALRISFDPSLPEDSVVGGVERSLVQHFTPFDTARMDSLLGSLLPPGSFHLSPLPTADSLIRVSSWSLLPGGWLSPSLGVKYCYAPLEHKAVLIAIALPLHPLLERMAWQLGLGLFLVLLLVACLWFLIRTIRRQRKMEQMREDFVHTMIHELRRPVQTLKMCISFLGDDTLRQDQAASREVLQDSLFELDSLSAYLGKLKDMVGSDQQPTLLHLSPLALPQLVEKVIRLTILPAGKHVSFSTTFPPEPLWLTADAVHLANVLSNLIENAIKYSGQKVRIRIAIVRHEKAVEITVADNGHGIAPAEQQKVFEKFYRSPHMPDKQVPGLGLGLSYVRQITEAHHGRLLLSSQPGAGTEVRVWLPVLKS